MEIDITISKKSLEALLSNAYDKGYANGWNEATCNFQENMFARREIENKAGLNHALFIAEEYHHSKGE